MMQSSDFTLKTKRLLAARVGYLCSCPEYRAPTSGPCVDSDKSVTAGDAAHITAASSGGPRFDPSLSDEERRSYNNGIWLCVNHARIVDQDESQHTVELLRHWKYEAENQASKELGRPQLVEMTSRTNFSKFIMLARAVVAALKTYSKESTILGIEGPVTQLSDLTRCLEIPVPIEIHTLPYPEDVVPHNPFLKDRLEGSCTIRFPDGSLEIGKASHVSGLELLVESRDSAIVALEQWVLVLEDDV